VAPAPPPAGAPLKERFLAEIKASKVFFFNTVVAAAYRVDVTPEHVAFTFLPNQKVPRQQCESARAWLETLAEKAAGRRLPVTVATTEMPDIEPEAPAAAAPVSQDDLRAAAMANPTVQALFEVFPVERTKVEEI
jgi:hypothetical protein